MKSLTKLNEDRDKESRDFEKHITELKAKLEKASKSTTGNHLNIN